MTYMKSPIFKNAISSSCFMENTPEISGLALFTLELSFKTFGSKLPDTQLDVLNKQLKGCSLVVC